MTNISVLGASGKVGQFIVAEINSTENLYLDEAINSGTMVGLQDARLANVDVLIDFSTPAATMALLDRLERNPLTLVIGTTGFSEEQTNRLRAEAKKRAILVGANFTKGFETFAATALNLVNVFPDATVTVGEIYNAKKKPAASGTTQRLVKELGAEGAGAVQTDIERIGDVAGVNTVSFDYGVAKLSLSLNVDSRAAYASGAIEAAQWLSQKPKGFYEPKDMLRPNP